MRGDVEGEGRRSLPYSLCKAPWHLKEEEEILFFFFLKSFPYVSN